MLVRVQLQALIHNAVCPGGEGAVLKTVGPKGLAGSNPVRGAMTSCSRGLRGRSAKSVFVGSNPTDVSFRLGM